MTLNTGARVGPFEILSPLGAGGMGEVYRARDSKLGREVAIKVLPAALAGSSERLARLRREAKLLASLNHPHIAAIYDFQESDGACALVMELVEGQTLHARLVKGALLLTEALDVAKQIVEALEYAHERGIVHRDLKPANLKLTPAGSVKVLDFGLAKALSEGSLSPEASSSPTETSDSTGEGVVLGTAAYMSPEQAQGKAVDRRTDIWSFGVVLYELLTGQRLFAGATGHETLALVITSEPDLGHLPAATPPSLRRLLRRCLEKDQARRLHDIGDARLEIEEAENERSVVSNVAATASRRIWLWTGGLIAALAIGGLGAALLLRKPPNASTTARRLTLAPPSGVWLLDPEAPAQHLAVSPDGRRVAFMGGPHRSELGQDDGSLYVQGIDDIEARAIPRTEGAGSPFFSPDGLWLGFGNRRRIHKVRLDVGEAPVTIADIPKDGFLRGASWGPDGTIVFSPGAFEGLWQVRGDGGTPRALTQPDAGHGEVSHRWPQILPDGGHVLFTNWRRGERPIWQESRLALLSLDTGKWRDIVEGIERDGEKRPRSCEHEVASRRVARRVLCGAIPRRALHGLPLERFGPDERVREALPWPGGERHVISSEGGMQPRWSRDGRELYYRGFGDHPKLMVVPVETRGRFRAGAPRPLFDDVYSEHAWTFARAAYDVMPDGRFVFVEEPPAAPAPNRLVLIPDWKRELEAKLRAGRP